MSIASLIIAMYVLCSGCSAEQRDAASLSISDPHSAKVRDVEDVEGALRFGIVLYVEGAYGKSWEHSLDMLLLDELASWDALIVMTSKCEKTADKAWKHSYTFYVDADADVKQTMSHLSLSLSRLAALLPDSVALSALELRQLDDES